LNVTDALLKACPLRLRPILMTTFATLAGALPGALNFGPGSETRVPMSVVVIGGVIVSTFFTLFVVPCLYSLVARQRRAFELDQPNMPNKSNAVDGMNSAAWN
jgi:multidrug efflux pump subunit AcrB